MNRVMIFIDAEYVVSKMRDLLGKRKSIKRTDINWKNIVHWIAGKKTLIRAYYYSSRLNKEENSQTYQEQQEYLKHLSHYKVFRFREENQELFHYFHY